MNCQHVEERLSDYMEGLVSRRAAGEIKTHLDSCPACRRLREEHLSLGSLLQKLGREMPPPASDLERWSVQRWLAAKGGKGVAPRVRSGHGSVWRLAAGMCGMAIVAGALSLGVGRWRSGGGAGPWAGHHHTAGAQGTQHAELIPAPTPGPSPNNWGRGDEAGDMVLAPLPQLLGEGPGVGAAVRSRLSPVHPSSHIPKSFGTVTAVAPGDLVVLNSGAEAEIRRWTPLPAGEWERIEARVRGHVRVKDDFVRIPFPRVATVSDRQIVAATEAYKREAAVVDARLAREVTVAAKGIALSDLCERLKADTGIEVRSGNSVADEKVTVFCARTPLREVMRQLSRPFGYTWLRSGKPGEYRYELAQDLKSQLLEEELRNRDRHQALLSLEKEIERFRPYLSLSPDEALAKAKSAAPAEKELLEKLSGTGWGALQMYGRLSSQEMGALLSGQSISFSEAPRTGEQGFAGPSTGVLPPDVARGVLQSMRFWRLVKSKGEGGVEGYEYTPDATAPGALPPSAIPSCRGRVVLYLDQSELGHCKLSGASYLYTIGSHGRQYYMGGSGADCATGTSPTVLQPNNAALNAQLASEPSLRARVTVEMAPDASRPTAQTIAAAAGEGGGPLAESKILIADALEALHRSTGLPVVADQYTRLYSPRAVAVRNKPLFETLNQLADAMRLRWSRENGWLQFRSTSYYDDRLKEVPNRMLARWAASRKEHGKLTLDDLCEIAQLSDAQLDGGDMAEGARDYLGLAEWDLARSQKLRPHLRFLAQLSPTHRQEAASADGLLFTRMPLAQQQRFMAMGMRGAPLQSVDELARATLRVSYTQPGSYQWGEPGWCGFYTRWVIPMGPEHQDTRVPRPPVVAPTREAALAAVRQIDPKMREALWQAVRRADSRLDGSPEAFEAQQIFPTERDLWFIYIPGGTNMRPIYVVGRTTDGECHYRQR